MKWNKMKWTKCSMEEAVQFMQGKTMIKLPKNISVPCKISNMIAFSDSTAVATESQFSGPFSKVTPDMDIEPPIFYKSGI